MITLHHLNASRSLRILWLLEEMGEPYTLIRYQRDPATHLAPASLKDIHPLGKSPVIELDGQVPVLLKLFTQFEINAGTQLKFLDGYTRTEFDKVLGFLDSALANRTFIVGDTLSGADFMLAFVAITVVEQMKCGAQYPHLQAYLQRLAALDSWKRALKLEHELDE